MQQRPMELVERDDVLRQLDHALRGVAGGTGHTFLIGGEAGIGKTSLLAALATRRGEADLWWGACDALQTPHPLAPLHDIARASEVGFHPLLGTDGNRPALFEAVLDELQHARRPTLLVVEDAHWADDATLDLLKFLGRRIDRAPCLLVVSYRDDEVTPTHPLRRLMGELPGSLLSRLELPRLSPAAVEMLARRALRSPAGIHAATQGNPFFVTELLRHGADGVPRGVQDLVLARYARLTPPAQAVVRLACVVPAKIERWLVDRLLAPDVGALEACLNSGLLTASTGALGFRHELARVAVESSLSLPVAQSLHGMIFRALDGDDTASASLARLVHHATHAGDIDAVLRLAPEAARQAQCRAAHREAVAHYRTALDALDAATGVDDTVVVDSRRGPWLEAYARECQLIDQLDEAIAARLQLGELHRRGNHPLAEAQNLSQLALVHVLALHNADADAASRRAIELLEALPPSVQLAGAYRVEAQLRMLNRDCESSIDWSNKAIALAERFGNREILAAGIGTLGSATLFLDYDAGCAHLRRALELALADGSHYIAANTYSNLGSGSGEVFQLRQARHYLLEAIAFAHKHEIDFYRNYAMAWLALCELYLGLWDDAAEHAADIVQQATHRTTSRVMALVALGRVRARRGDPGVDEVLDEALQLALASNTLQRIAPVRAARAEAAWLRGDLAAVDEEARAALALAAGHRHPWFTGEFAYWLHRAGTLEVLPEPCAEPFLLQIQGRCREAADAWAALGCPYEQARALGEGDTPARLEALQVFEQLGARPAAERLRRELQAAGVRGLPKGMRASTQANPHQLTAREVEVLRLLCEGLKNSEIAERLCRSVRTIDHHLAATFAKLGVASRTEAVAAALQVGLGSKK